MSTIGSSSSRAEPYAVGPGEFGLEPDGVASAESSAPLDFLPIGAPMAPIPFWNAVRNAPSSTLDRLR